MARDLDRWFYFSGMDHECRAAVRGAENGSPVDRSARADASNRAARGGEFSLPITQIDLGDCLGLSVVHTNRTLQALRGERLVESDRSGFNLLDEERLKELAGFDRTYLHLTPSR
jgi:hypothetical protein